MAGVLGNEFKAKVLESGLAKAAQEEDAYIMLFTNDYTPLEDDELADYTEATFSGYAQIPLLGSGWTVTPGAPAVAVQAEVEFASNADQAAETVYGYAIFLDYSGTFLGAERFGTEQVVQNDGDAIRVTPRIRAYTKA